MTDIVGDIGKRVDRLPVVRQQTFRRKPAAGEGIVVKSIGHMRITLGAPPADGAENLTQS